MPKAARRKGANDHVVRYVGLVCAVAKDSFIPHEGNDHRPHALRHGALVGYSVLMILIKTLAIALPIALPSSSLYSSAVTVKNIVDITNQARANLGLSSLVQSALLNKAAQAKAMDMLKNQYFAHISPTGRSPWDFIHETGYSYLYSGENLAVHYSTAEDVEGGWIASPTHRANIVNPRYTEIGVGVVAGSFEGTSTLFVVQMFATPRTDEVETGVVENALVASQTQIAASPTLVKVPEVPKAVEPIPKAKLTPPEDVLKIAPTPSQPTTVTKPTSAPDPTPSTVAIDDSNTFVTQQADRYHVTVTVSNATSVLAQLSTQLVQLDPQPGTDVWSGDVPFQADSFSPSGEPISVVAWGDDRRVTSTQIALVLPHSDPQHLYIFNEGADRFATIGGIVIRNLQDKVRMTYAFVILTLGAALLLTVFIRFHIQRPTLIAHTIGVISLAVLLAVL